MSSHDKSGIWTVASGRSPFGNSRVPGAKTRIVIADDHGPYRRGLRAMLEMEPDLHIVGEAADGKEAVEQVAKLKPDLVLMDVNMPAMDGMQAARALADTYPGLLIVMLTMFKGDEHLKEARRAGASAYVLKDAGREELLQTIRDVVSGENPLMQRHSAQRDEPEARPRRIEEGPSGTDRLLTANERAILRLLAAEHTNDQIGSQIGMPESMVRTYLAEIYRKIGLSGRDAAVKYARERGFDKPLPGDAAAPSM